MKATLQAILITALAIATIALGVWIVRPLAANLIPIYPVNAYTNVWLGSWPPVLITGGYHLI